jgi:hypothetical protein
MRPSSRPTQYDLKRDPTLGAAYSYWCAKRGARAMPRRRDIDPSEISPRLLPFLQITELLDGGSRIRYRLVGTAIVAAYGADLTGRHLDEVVSGERLRFVEDNYRRIYREKRPSWCAANISRRWKRISYAIASSCRCRTMVRLSTDASPP